MGFINYPILIKFKQMKSVFLITICLFSYSYLNAQQTFSIPELTSDQEKEILYNHVMAYAITGIGFAKFKGATPKEFGEFIGNQFKSYWDPAAGFPVFVNGMLFILTGMHPDNEMQIIEQSDKIIRFKLKNVDLSFKNGPVYGVTYDEFLECSEGIISTLAQHMNVSFSHKIADETWYEVTLTKK